MHHKQPPSYIDRVHTYVHSYTPTTAQLRRASTPRCPASPPSSCHVATTSGSLHSPRRRCASEVASGFAATASTINLPPVGGSIRHSQLRLSPCFHSAWPTRAPTVTTETSYIVSTAGLQSVPRTVRSQCCVDTVGEMSAPPRLTGSEWARRALAGLSVPPPARRERHRFPHIEPNPLVNTLIALRLVGFPC